MIIYRSIHVAASGIMSFILMGEWYSIVCVCVCVCVCVFIYFIHSSVDGHLGCFYVLVIVNSAEMNIGIYVSF